jgi:hypothetical protein
LSFRIPPVAVIRVFKSCVYVFSLHSRCGHISMIKILNLRIVGGGVQTGSTRHVGHLLAYCTCSGWLWGWRIWWNEWQGKPKYSEKTCHGATLSTTNPTWPDPVLNPGRRGGKPATNRFSYGAATSPWLPHLLFVGG